jgi:hypothetical protein
MQHRYSGQFGFAAPRTRAAYLIRRVRLVAFRDSVVVLAGGTGAISGLRSQLIF